MNRLSRIAVVVALLLPATVHAQSAAVGVLAAKSGEASMNATATGVRARVVELDKAARLLTLMGPDGSLHSIHVPARVKNLAQVRLGDELVVRHLVAQISRLEPASASGNRERIETIKTTGSIPGGMPGFTEERTVEIIAKVFAIDAKARTATLRGAKRTVVVSIPKDYDISRLKENEDFHAVFTDAVAVSVEHTTPKK